MSLPKPTIRPYTINLPPQFDINNLKHIKSVDVGMRSIKIPLQQTETRLSQAQGKCAGKGIRIWDLTKRQFVTSVTDIKGVLGVPNTVIQSPTNKQLAKLGFQCDHVFEKQYSSNILVNQGVQHIFEPDTDTASHEILSIDTFNALCDVASLKPNLCYIEKSLHDDKTSFFKFAKDNKKSLSDDLYYYLAANRDIGDFAEQILSKRDVLFKLLQSGAIDPGIIQSYNYFAAVSVTPWVRKGGWDELKGKFWVTNDNLD